jgi:hypothetical protein
MPYYTSARDLGNFTWNWANPPERGGGGGGFEMGYLAPVGDDQESIHESAGDGGRL